MQTDAGKYMGLGTCQFIQINFMLWYMIRQAQLDAHGVSGMVVDFLKQWDFGPGKKRRKTLGLKTLLLAENQATGAITIVRRFLTKADAVVAELLTVTWPGPLERWNRFVFPEFLLSNFKFQAVNVYKSGNVQCGYFWA